MYDYDFKNVTVAWGGQLITGFADGEGVRIAFNKERAGLAVGIDGEAARSKFNNKSAKITIVLMQTSESNALFSAGAKAQDKKILTIKDNNSDFLGTALNAWVQAYPEMGFAGEAGNREWVLETDDMDISE